MEAEGTFKGVDGADLFYRVLEPSGKPKAAVIAVHGLGDHSGGLQHLCESLAENEYLTLACDLRGHGMSSGKRGFIRDWKEYREDLHLFRSLVASEVPELPLFLAGHSLGGVISLDYVMHYGENLEGLITISPGISYGITTMEKVIISLLGKLKPDYTITKTSNPDVLTRDVEIAERLLRDPLRHGQATAGLGLGMSKVIPAILNQPESIQLPYLMMYGLDDALTPPEKLSQFYHRVGSQDKQKLEYVMRHRPFDDIGREQFFEDLNTWLDAQLAKRQAV